MSIPFMEALQRRDLETASRELGATTTEWLAEQLVDFLELPPWPAQGGSVDPWLARAGDRVHGERWLAPGDRIHWFSWSA